MLQVDFCSDITITPEIQATVQEYRDKLDGWQAKMSEHRNCQRPRECYCGVIKINMAILDKLITTVERRIRDDNL